MQDSDDETTQGATGPLTTPEKGRTTPVLVVVGGARTTIGRVYRIAEDLLIGRAGESDVWLDTDGVSRRHAKVQRLGEEIFIEDMGSKNGTYVNGDRISRKQLAIGDLVQVGATHILRFTWQDALDEAAHRALLENAIRDGLTGAYNRSYFLDQLRKEVSSSMRHRNFLSLAVLDLDHFKDINDTYGHAAGDLVLRHFSRAVTALIRNEDTFGRIGGDEFALLLRQCPEAEAVKVLDRIRASVQKLDLQLASKPVTVTVSVGVTALEVDMVSSDAWLLESADQALYRAKQAGRNRVEGTAVTTQP